MNAFRKNLTAAKTHDELEKIGQMATGPDPIQLNAFPLVFGGRSIYGSLADTAIDTEDVLAFGVLENMRLMIENLPSAGCWMLSPALCKAKHGFAWC